MLSKPLRHAATLGIVALVPIFAANAALAVDSHRDSRHDDLGNRLLSGFEVPAGATKSLIPGGEEHAYRVCASSENSGSVSVHYDPHLTQALRPGQCENIETSQLAIENSAKAGTAYGTYQRTVM